MRLPIDSGLMFVAASNAGAGSPLNRGFLHRRTGRIVIVGGEIGETEAHFGMEVATAAIFDQAAIDNAPGDWLEIPKYTGNGMERETEDFIDAFLKQHGIDPIFRK